MFDGLLLIDWRGGCVNILVSFISVVKVIGWLVFCMSGRIWVMVLRVLIVDVLFVDLVVKFDK